MFLKESNQWHNYCDFIIMRKTLLFVLFISLSSSLTAQGNLGINFGLNDDNFGSIENIKNKKLSLNNYMKLQNKSEKK